VRGELSPTSKLTDADIIKIVERLNAGETTVRISKDYEVDRATISSIKNGGSWTHITSGLIEGFIGYSGLKKSQIEDMRKRYLNGETVAKIFCDYSLPRQVIYRIVKNKTFKNMN